jgi:outer membrane receptor protein involved in Fe transport
MGVFGAPIVSRGRSEPDRRFLNRSPFVAARATVEEEIAMTHRAGIGSPSRPLAAVVVMALAAMLLAAGTAAAAPVTFNIEAQEMGAALRLFAEQAQVQVLYGDDVVAGVKSAGLKGTLEVEAGLKELLKGSRLSYERTDEKTFVVVRQAGQTAEGPAGRFSEDMVVTATRREEKAGEIPASVSVVDGGALQESGAAKLEDYIQQSAGVLLNKTNPQMSQVVMRGVSTNQTSGLSQQPVGFFVDEVAVSDYFWSISTLDLTPFDLERVEVLRGPQGTLFGAATLGGAVRYITAKPDLTRFGGAVNLTASSVASGGTSFLPQAMVNVPLADGKLALRGVIAYNGDGGYVDNSAIGKEDWNSFTQTSGRLLARWQPNERLRLDAMWIAQDTTLDGNGLVDPTDDPDFEDPTHRSYRLNDDNYKQNIGNLGLTWDLGPATLLSLTSYVEKTRRAKIELGSLVAYDQATTMEYVLMSIGVPVTPGQISSVVTEAPSTAAPHENRIWTQEFRLVSKPGSRFDWIAGAYYTDVESHAVTLSRLVGIEDTVNGIVPGLGTTLFPDDLTVAFDARQPATEWAGYGELGFNLSERVKLTAGGRYFEYSSDTPASILSFGSQIPIPDLHAEDSGFKPKVSISYRPNESLMWYALASQGYRVGGANVTAALAPPSALIPLTYKTDQLTNYEAGVKTTSAGGRLQADATVFYIDWSDIQLNGNFAVPNAPGGAVMATLNTGKAHSLGVEGAVNAQLATGLNLNAALAWTEAELDEDSVPIRNDETGQIVVLPKGTTLPSTPNWSGSATLSYFLDAPNLGYPSVSLSYLYKGSILDGIPQLVELPSYSLVNLRVAATLLGRFQLSLAANNLLDERSPITRQAAIKGTFVPETLPELFVITQPRTIALTLQTKF